MVKEAKRYTRIISAMDEPKSQRTRRNKLSAAALGLLSLVIVLAAVRDAPTSPLHLTLLYVGASDCAPCRSWQNNEGARFRSSMEFSRLEYREIKSPTLRDVLRDDYWPEDLRSYRARLDRGTAVPLWLIVVNDHVVASAFGTTGWNDQILPYLRAALH